MKRFLKNQKNYHLFFTIFLFHSVTLLAMDPEEGGLTEELEGMFSRRLELPSTTTGVSGNTASSNGPNSLEGALKQDIQQSIYEEALANMAMLARKKAEEAKKKYQASIAQKGTEGNESSGEEGYFDPVTLEEECLSFHWDVAICDMSNKDQLLDQARAQNELADRYEQEAKKRTMGQETWRDVHLLQASEYARESNLLFLQAFNCLVKASGLPVDHSEQSMILKGVARQSQYLAFFFKKASEMAAQEGAPKYTRFFQAAPSARHSQYCLAGAITACGKDFPTDIKGYKRIASLWRKKACQNQVAAAAEQRIAETWAFSDTEEWDLVHETKSRHAWLSAYQYYRAAESENRAIQCQDLTKKELLEKLSRQYETVGECYAKPTPENLEIGEIATATAGALSSAIAALANTYDKETTSKQRPLFQNAARQYQTAAEKADKAKQAKVNKKEKESLRYIAEYRAAKEAAEKLNTQARELAKNK